MGGSQSRDHSLDAADAASLLEWWMESGVDLAISEEPRDWRRAPAAVAPTLAPVASPEPVEAPGDLAAFHAWLSSATGLPLDRGGSRRILPMGGADAPIMLLADLPTQDEATDSRPIAGDAWALTVRMLQAIGIEPGAAYLANLACFHAPGSRIDSSDLERCAVIARDHVRLARPKRLLLLGDAPARAITGQTLANARGHVHRVEGVRAVATFHPRWLLQRPSDKALAWKDLLLLMSDEG